VKKTMKAYLLFKAQDGSFDVWNFKPYSEEEYVCLDSKDVDFDIADDFDPRPLRIKALEEKEKQAAAAFYAMKTDIRREISQLQALEVAA